jgi:hypothetical protein
LIFPFASASTGPLNTSPRLDHYGRPAFFSMTIFDMGVGKDPI